MGGRTTPKDRMRRVRPPWLTALAVFACGPIVLQVLGCSDLTFDNSESDSFDRPGQTPPSLTSPEEALGWKRINAAQGGTVEIPDGAWLEVPPNALPHDMIITVRIPNPPSKADHTYVLEPAGTEFLRQVILHIPYPVMDDGRLPLHTVFQASELNPIVSGPSEQIDWAYADIVGDDEANHVLSVGLDHFSAVNAFFNIDKNAYIVLDFPWETYAPGDAVFALTEVKLAVTTPDGPTWSPGHVGTLSVITPDDEMATFAIEATSPASSTAKGVHQIYAKGVKGSSSHLFMGVRRPPGGLTDDERKRMLVWLYKQVGKGYNIVTRWDYESYSCVGLAETALDQVGKGVLSAYTETMFATPLEMFHGTVPVSEVYVRPGETIEFPVYGVVVDPESPILGRSMRGWYTRDLDRDNKLLYTITASNRPEGATWEQQLNGYKFRWTPTYKDSCKSTSECEPRVIELELTTYENGLLAPILGQTKVRQKLLVNTTGASMMFSIPPLKEGENGWYISRSIPKKATPHGVHVFLEDTDQELANGVPIQLSPGVTLGVTFAQTSDVTDANGGLIYSGHVQVQNDTGQELPSPGTLRLFVDYSIEHWLHTSRVYDTTRN